MRIKKLKNVSNESITVQHNKNSFSVLPPNADLIDVNVTDESISKLKDKISYTADLGEIVENNKSRTQLRD